ncbi:MAG: hypothetical protein AMJ38_02205 [Dehalococcoidia bacterium DG_22]|nr:MAG: hypothetical protein AMJ38_02205 [Dehalococcoidia bacterium DG_22]
MLTRAVVMTLPEYQKLRWGTMRRVNGRWYRVGTFKEIGVFFHRSPKVVVKMTLNPCAEEPAS